LGALVRAPGRGTIPVWLTSAGLLISDEYRPEIHAPGLHRALRWAGAPATWRGFSTLGPRSRSLVRRGASVPRHCLRRRRASPAAAGAPVGFLLREPGPGRVALYGAIHPVTGDQLLTRRPAEAREMG